MSVIVKGGGGKPEEEKTVTAGTSVIEISPSSGKVMKKVTVNPTPTESKSVTPTTSELTVTPSEGKHFSQFTVQGDANFIEENIKSGVTIWGKTGTAKGGFPNGTEWTQVNDGKIYEAICYAKGIWVAGGSNNASGIRYSLDGKTWTQSNKTSGKIFHIYYADGLWIASSLYVHYISEDAKTWTTVELIFGQVIKSNGLWVACGGDNNGMFYSTDGKTWSNSNITSGGFRLVHNANGTWVAGADGMNSAKGLYYSLDGKTWTQSNITSGASWTISFYDGIWVAGVGNYLYYSTDGKTWTQSLSCTADHTHNSNGLWVLCTYDNGLYYSEDGKTWTQSNITSGVFVWSHNANGIWVALGQDTTSLGIYYSLDGKTWTQSNITSGYFYQVHNENGLWVAGYNNGVCYSPTWEPT